MKKKILTTIAIMMVMALAACATPSQEIVAGQNQTPTTEGQAGNVSGDEAVKTTTEAPDIESTTAGEVITTEAPTTTAHVHDYAEAITIEATCTAEGVKTFTCECGDSYTRVIPATGHSHEKIVTKEKTCEEDGMCTYTCTCGDSYERPLAATGHSFGAYAYNNDATYLADGTETAKCSVCGAEDIRTAEGTRKDDGFTYRGVYMRTRVETSLYTEPSEGATVMESLPKRERVSVSAQSEDKQWYRVEYGDKTGYIKMDHLISRDYGYTDLDYVMDEDYHGPNEAKLAGFTFTEMSVIWYTAGHTGFLDSPSWYANRVGTADIFVPIHITGKCNEDNFYRAEVDGLTVFVHGDLRGRQTVNPQFLTELPEVTKGDPFLKAGTKEWHDYWDGTTMGEVMVITGFKPWIKIDRWDGNGHVYNSYYPLDYVIGSYADVTYDNSTAKGVY